MVFTAYQPLLQVGTDFSKIGCGLSPIPRFTSNTLTQLSNQVVQVFLRQHSLITIEGPFNRLITNPLEFRSSIYR